jgi:uncharacterized membrane protein
MSKLTFNFNKTPMKKEHLQQHLLAGLILLAPVVYLLIVWNTLPERIAIHWNAQGQADGYGSRSTLLALAGLNVGIYLLLVFLPRIDPRRQNVALSSPTYIKIRIATVVLMSIVLMAAVLMNQGVQIDMLKIIFISTLVFFAILGNYFSRVRPNYFVGIRTPWTLENDTVWRKTHQMAGKLWFWTSLALLPLVVLLESNILVPVFLAATLMLAFVPVAYSYYVFGQVKRSETGSAS